MAKQRRKTPRKRNGKINPAKVTHLAAAIFWIIRLILLLWDRRAR